jgi:hypothetical protein
LLAHLSADHCNQGQHLSKSKSPAARDAMRIYRTTRHTSGALKHGLVVSFIVLAELSMADALKTVTGKYSLRSQLEILEGVAILAAGTLYDDGRNPAGLNSLLGPFCSTHVKAELSVIAEDGRHEVMVREDGGGYLSVSFHGTRVTLSDRNAFSPGDMIWLSYDKRAFKVYRSSTGPQCLAMAASPDAVQRFEPTGVAATMSSQEMYDLACDVLPPDLDALEPRLASFVQHGKLLEIFSSGKATRPMPYAMLPVGSFARTRAGKTLGGKITFDLDGVDLDVGDYAWFRITAGGNVDVGGGQLLEPRMHIFKSKDSHEVLYGQFLTTHFAEHYADIGMLAPTTAPTLFRRSGLPRGKRPRPAEADAKASSSKLPKASGSKLPEASGSKLQNA